MKFKIIEEITLNEMAMNRADAIEKCNDLGKKFIEHFHKCYTTNDKDNINHWLSEMDAWYKSVCNIKLKENNKPLLNQKLSEWFFTAGADASDFVDMTEDEIIAYDEYYHKVINNKDVKFSYYEVVGE